MIDAKLGDLINQKDYGGDDYEEMEYAPVICQVTFKCSVFHKQTIATYLIHIRDLWWILHFVYFIKHFLLNGPEPS